MIKVTKSQILHVLSSFVIVPVAGFLSAWTAKHFPGLPHFTPDQISKVFVTGAGGALGLAIHYLHGLQIWERTAGKVIDVTDTTPKA